MGYFRNPFNWKNAFVTEVVFFSNQSTLESGLIPGGRGSDKKRQTVFFTLNPFDGDSDEEEPCEDWILKKVHYHSYWKRDQDAVWWIKLSRTQDQRLQFSQMKSYAIIAHSLVPADCIYKVICRNRRRNVIRKTLDSTTCANSHTQKQLAIATTADAVEAVDLRGLDLHRKLVQDRNGITYAKDNTKDDQTRTRRSVLRVRC